jgi:hypothetical protein
MKMMDFGLPNSRRGPSYEWDQREQTNATEKVLKKKKTFIKQNAYLQRGKQQIQVSERVAYDLGMFSRVKG